MASSPTKKRKIDYAKVQEALDFAHKLIKKEGANAEAYLITFHVVKDGRVIHHFNYHDFPNGDWGAAVIAAGVEARRAKLMSETGGNRI